MHNKRIELWLNAIFGVLIIAVACWMPPLPVLLVVVVAIRAIDKRGKSAGGQWRADGKNAADTRGVAAALPDDETVAGERLLTCPVCANKRFIAHKARLSARLASLVRLDWRGQLASAKVCTRCGYVHWFRRHRKAEVAVNAVLGTCLLALCAQSHSWRYSRGMGLENQGFSVWLPLCFGLICVAGALHFRFRRRPSGTRFCDSSANGKLQWHCALCGGIRFKTERGRLTTRIASALSLDLKGQRSDCEVCETCGHVHWFRRDFERRPKSNDGSHKSRFGRMWPLVGDLSEFIINGALALGLVWTLANDCVWLGLVVAIPMAVTGIALLRYRQQPASRRFVNNAEYDTGPVTLLSEASLINDSGDPNTQSITPGAAMECGVCGGQMFRSERARIGTRLASIVGLRWHGKIARAEVCDRCGHAHWFFIR